MIHYYLDETSGMLGIPSLTVLNAVSVHRVEILSCQLDTRHDLMSQAVKPCETFDTAYVSMLTLHWLLLLLVAKAILELDASSPLL